MSQDDIVVAMEGLELVRDDSQGSRLMELLACDDDVPLIFHLRDIGWELVKLRSPRQQYVFGWMFIHDTNHRLFATDADHLRAFYGSISTYLINLLRFGFDLTTITVEERRVALAILVVMYILGCKRRRIGVALGDIPDKHLVHSTIVSTLFSLPGLDITLDIQSDTSIRVQIPLHDIDCVAYFVL